ncbi:MAG: sigma-70 family RNA polymerase sigma factor, partial [Bacteroidota bacterium]
VQNALIKAIQTWKNTNIPDNPAGWIIKVAQNQLLDELRKKQRQQNLEVAVEQRISPSEPNLDSLTDDQIRMMFACCHPSLSSSDQLILILKILGGLSIREIAGSLMKKEDSIAKAYTRAKKKFKNEEIQLRLPAANDIAERLDLVLKIVYLLFNEGYKAVEGPGILRKELCAEAIRLTEILVANDLCSTPSTYALLALMLFHSARFDARIDEEGLPISLEDQNRSLWDRRLIDAGLEALTTSMESNEMNEYIMQAAISGEHCIANSFEETNWHRILSYYDQQLKQQNSIVVALNRVIPLEKVKGPLAASQEIEKLEKTAHFDEYYLFYAIKSEVLRSLDETEEAKENLKKAIALATNGKEKEYLKKKLNQL